jgi:hypothetical protein
LESSRTVFVVTALVKEGEMGGQGHTFASLLHQSAMCHLAVNAHCFYMSTSSTSCFLFPVIDGKIEQCVCIKFCMKLGKSTAETLNASWGFWRTLFKSDNSFWMTFTFQGWSSVNEDDERSRWPSTNTTTENVEKIWELVYKDCCRTILELTDTTGISYGVCQEILTECLEMRHTATKFVPQLLTNGQKQHCVNVCLELWEKANEDPSFYL